MRGLRPAAVALVLAAVAAFSAGAEPATAPIGQPKPVPSASLQPPTDKVYPIHFFAASKVGSRRSEQQRLTQHIESTVRRGEEVVHREVTDNEIRVFATIEVLEVSRQGCETRLRIAIGQATLTPKGEAPREILPADSVVIAESTPRGTAFRSERPEEKLPEQAARLLPRIFLLIDPGEVSDEEIFGRPVPQRLGARWEANKSRLAMKLRSFDKELQPQEVDGTAQLVNIAQIGGREHVDLVYEITAQSRHPANPPPATVPLSASLKLSGAVRFPADYRTGWIAWKQHLEVEGRFQGEAGTRNEGLTFAYQSVESHDSRAAYLDPK